MKFLALTPVFLLMAWSNAQNQTTTPPPEDYFVIEGDTIIHSEIELKEVVLFQPLRFENYDEAKRYVILRERTYRVYPFAKIAADRLEILNTRLDLVLRISKRSAAIFAKG